MTAVLEKVNLHTVSDAVLETYCILFRYIEWKKSKKSVTLSLRSCCSDLEILCQWKYATSHSKIPVFLLNMLKNNDKFELQEYAYS